MSHWLSLSSYMILVFMFQSVYRSCFRLYYIFNFKLLCFDSSVLIMSLRSGGHFIMLPLDALS